MAQRNYLRFGGGGGSSTGTPRQRSRRKQQQAPSDYERAQHAGRVPQAGVPYGPRQTVPSRSPVTPPGVRGPVGTPGTEDSGGGRLPDVDLASALRILVDPFNTPDALEPVGTFARQEAEDSLSNIVKQLAKPTPLPQQTLDLPTGDELKAAADILSLTPIGAPAKAVRGGEAVVRAIRASEDAAKVAVKGAARAAEPAVVRGARRGVARSAGKAAERLPKPVKVAGGRAASAASLPWRRPLTTPIAAQAPAAAISGDPSEFGKAFTGEGTLASITGSAGEAVGSALPGTVTQNLVKDVFNLPSVVLPSIYLPVAGLVEASQGDSSRLRSLWDDYMESGAIPAALRGDPEGVLHAVESHPLFTALEASGTAAVVGRGAGAVVRGTTRGRVGGTERPPVYIRGQEQLGNVNELMGRGRYSPDLIRQVAQRVYDARRGSTIEPRGGVKGFLSLDPATRALRHTARRFVYGEEQARRVNRSNREKLMRGAEPDRASAGVVAQAVQRIAQRPDSFFEDLPAYRAQLEQAYQSGQLTSAQRKANRSMVAQLDRAIDSANPEQVAKAADTFIEEQGKIVTGLVDRGLLNEEQALRAALFPWARVHMGADHKPDVGLVDRDGNPLKTEEIVARMQSEGVQPPGFVSQKPRSPGAGAYFQAAFPERQSLRTQPRSGRATLEGTYDASYRALTEQLLYSGAKLDAAKTYDNLVRQFGTRVPEGVKNMRDAWDALQDPERFGWQDPSPRLPKRPIRVAPFLAAREEIAKAQAHQGLDSPLLDPSQAAASEALTAKLLTEAGKEGPGPYAYIPEPVHRELEGLFRRSGTGEKVGQSLGQLAKGAWLPFSPSFYTGNFVDNFLRAAFAGIGPFDVILGRQAIKGRKGIPGLVDRDLAASESIASGAGYSSVIRQRIHRDSRQFEGTALQGFARGLEAFSEKHGPKEALSVYRKSRDLLLGLNSKLSERLPAYGAIGKELRRELQAKQGHWHHALMVSDDAFKDLLDGLRGTDKQIQYARAVEQVLGNWGKVGRAGRVLSSFAPFWQWARASTRLVFLTLPAHHPIKTAILAAAAEMTEEERAKLGLDKYVGSEPLPGFLQGNIPLGEGITKNLGKYTSFGVFGEYPEFLGRLFLPQAQTPLQILQGVDWKGEKIEKADGTPIDDPERVGLAILVAGEQFIPGLALLESATGISLPGNTGGDEGPGKFSPLATYEGGKLDYFRSLPSSRQITVPAKGGSSSSGFDYSPLFEGGGSTSYDYSKLFEGGGG